MTRPGLTAYDVAEHYDVTVAKRVEDFGSAGFSELIHFALTTNALRHKTV